MKTRLKPGEAEFAGSWLGDPAHRAWLEADARRQLDFFRASLRADGGFDVLKWNGSPLNDAPQELHTTTRLVHSYALGRAFGDPGSGTIIDAGMDFLWTRHRDTRNGGYVWSVGRSDSGGDGTKLAYGHVFVLLAGASAKVAGHPDADRLIADVAEVIDRHYWDESRGLLRDEFSQDWVPFSTYRGMNANMHGVEALLVAFEATGDSQYLRRAGRILDFFIGTIAPAHGWRIPEHYTEDWQVDPGYQGNPMFRPAGTTPGHSLELGRLVIQHWDLSGRPNSGPDSGAVGRARKLIGQALADAWLPEGGFAYTLALGGGIGVRNRYWWPVTEAIGALATLLKVDPQPEEEAWYRKLWTFADAHFVDHETGGWFPEIGADGEPTAHQFHGKPDIYHALQADLFPLAAGVSRPAAGLSARRAATA